MRKWLSAVRNARFVRAPILTHMMVDPPPLPQRRLPNACSLSDAFLQRLCAAYAAAEPPQAADIWTGIADKSSVFRDLLRKADIQGLRRHLENLFGETTLWGMGHSSAFIERDSEFDVRYFSDRCRDALFSLAEALAVRGLMSNAQTPLDLYARSLNGDLSLLLPDVEAALGHSLSPTSLGGPPVADAGATVLNPDFLRHAYIMHRVQEIGIRPEQSILEIGGGFGCVARYAYMRGLRNFTIIDLPFSNALQAAFLADSLGEDAVTLYGEAPTGPIRLIPSTAKDALADKYDLVLNMDSLPEIDEAMEYIGLIRTKATYFLSVNQEAQKVGAGFKQHIVPHLVAEAGGFRRLSRHRYWMEDGYAEELYVIS